MTHKWLKQLFCKFYKPFLVYLFVIDIILYILFLCVASSVDLVELVYVL